MTRTIQALLWAIVLLGAGVASASEQQNNEMNRLATAKGCHTCHSLEPQKSGAQEKLPIGPAWKDVAKKYKGQKDAEDRLTKIVVHASEPGKQGRHWEGKAKGAAMPANAIVINEADARKLVRWILASDN